MAVSAAGWQEGGLRLEGAAQEGAEEQGEDDDEQQEEEEQGTGSGAEGRVWAREGAWGVECCLIGDILRQGSSLHTIWKYDRPFPLGKRGWCARGAPLGSQSLGSGERNYWHWGAAPEGG